MLFVIAFGSFWSCRYYSILWAGRDFMEKADERCMAQVLRFVDEGDPQGGVGDKKPTQMGRRIMHK
jgi:hypothetical protein